MPRLNIRLVSARTTDKPFRYRDYGQLATIGRKAAVAVLGKVKLSGFPAWFVWLIAHIYFLINFRNRLVVMIDLGGRLLDLPALRQDHHQAGYLSAGHFTWITPFMLGCSPQM